MKCKTQKLRNAIKNTTWLYCLLLPCVKVWRQIVYLLTRSKTQYFRDCCYSLSACLSRAYFVNVGANDGIVDTPGINILIGNKNWHGLLIEPVPYCFEKLKLNFPDAHRFKLEQVAIGPCARKEKFYYVDKAAIKHLADLPAWYDKLGSFDRQHIFKHLGSDIEPYVIECIVEVSRLTDLVSRNKFPHIHLLHIDTEGYDLEVLKTLDFTRYHPVMIFIEHIHHSPQKKKEMRTILRNNGYSICDCGMDYFALDRRQFRLCRKQKP